MRRNKERLQYLKNVSMFAALDDDDLALIDRLAEKVDINAGQELMREGAVGHEFYVLLSGKAEVIRHGQTLTTLGAGDHVGELALLDPKPRTATVRMTEAGMVLEITQRAFWQLLDDVPLLARKVLQGLAGRLHDEDKLTA